MKTLIKMFVVSMLLAAVLIFFITHTIIRGAKDPNLFKNEIEEHLNDANTQDTGVKKLLEERIEKAYQKKQNKQALENEMIPSDTTPPKYAFFKDELFDYSNYDSPRPLYSVLDPEQKICDGIENIDMQEMLEFTKLTPNERRKIKLCEQFSFISMLIAMNKYQVLEDALKEPNINLTVFAKVKNKNGIENNRTLLTQAILSPNYQSLDVLYNRLLKEDTETFNKIVYTTLMGLIKEPKTFEDKEMKLPTSEYIQYLIKEGYAEQLDKVLKNEIPSKQVTEGVLHDVILRLSVDFTQYSILKNALRV